MDASFHTGPLTILPNGRLLRAGRGSALYWPIDELEAHRTAMKIGKGRYFYGGDYTALDEDVNIEPQTTVPFSQRDFKPYRWHLHRPTGHMLRGEDGQYGYRVLSLDFDSEYGGAVVARCVGHGGSVRGCAPVRDRLLRRIRNTLWHPHAASYSRPSRRGK